MPNNKHIALHGFEVAQGVEQGFTLLGRRSAHADIEHVCGQAFGGQFERGAGARAVFKKQIRNSLAAQQRDFFYRFVIDTSEVLRGVENFSENLPAQCLYAEEVTKLTVGVELYFVRAGHLH